MTDQFTEEQLRMATFRMSLENNAMLRVLLANQVKIMEKLELDIEMPRNAIADLIPGNAQDPEDYLPLFIKFVSIATEAIQKRAWEWVQMNGNISDNG